MEACESWIKATINPETSVGDILILKMAFLCGAGWANPSQYANCMELLYSMEPAVNMVDQIEKEEGEQ
jgi:hypothetical protein